MNQKRFARIAAIAAIFAAGAAQAASPNLVKNGGFSQTNALSVPTSGYVTVEAGSDAISHWTIDKNSVDVVNNAYGSIDGFSLDMIGTPGLGAITQKIKGLQADTNYVLTFDLGLNPGAAKGAIKVDFLGQSKTFTSPTTGYVMETWNISSSSILSAADAKLKFAAVNKGDTFSGAILDNVSLTVSAVPEPETYGMLLGGLGLIGFIARRKRNKAA